MSKKQQAKHIDPFTGEFDPIAAEITVTIRASEVREVSGRWTHPDDAEWSELLRDLFLSEAGIECGRVYRRVVDAGDMLNRASRPPGNG